MAEDVTFDRYVPSTAQAQQAQALIRLLQERDAQGVAVSVFGGYGLDALYGRLTRDHGDFDLVVMTEAQAHLSVVLEGQGYEHVPQWSESGRKEVFVHAALAAPFKVEVAVFDRTTMAQLAQQYRLEMDMSLFLPDMPNGQLLGYPVRTPTLDGVEIVNLIQRQTGIARGWAEFLHQEHQAKLMALLRRRKSLSSASSEVSV
jgi:hypothetical protein